MKRMILSLCAVAMMAGCATTQKEKYKSIRENEVPEKYSRDFHKRRADVEQVNWQMADSNCYIASFKSNENTVRMKFRNTSVETSWLIPSEYTPSNITDYIKANYEGYKTEEVNIVEIRNQKTYRVSIYKKKEFKLLEFDLQGTFVQEVED